MLIALLGMIVDELQMSDEEVSTFGDRREWRFLGSPVVAEYSDLDEVGGEIHVELDIAGARYWVPKAELELLEKDPQRLYVGEKRGQAYGLRVLWAVPAAIQDLSVRLSHTPAPAPQVR